MACTDWNVPQAFQKEVLLCTVSQAKLEDTMLSEESQSQRMNVDSTHGRPLEQSTMWVPGAGELLRSGDGISVFKMDGVAAEKQPELTSCH
jgi:hypothetical protein